MESGFKGFRSKTFQWGKKGLLSKIRTKKGPVIELLRTFSRYFCNNAKRSKTVKQNKVDKTELTERDVVWSQCWDQKMWPFIDD